MSASPLPSPLRGYCIMIDICGSTERKNSPGWAEEFYKVFYEMRMLFNIRPEERALSKIVGDMLMVWLPVEASAAAGLLWNYKLLLDHFYGSLKAAMVLTDECYWLSFEFDKPDVYG